MTCAEARELACLHTSGELALAEKQSFLEHLASCPDCERALEDQARLDARIVAAASLHYDSTRVEAAIRQRIARARIKRIWSLSAAAAVLACALGFSLWYSRPISPLYQGAARDHWAEVVQGQPRHWVSGSHAVAGFLQKYGVTAAETQALAAAGLSIERVKICGVNGKPALHLVLTDGRREYSLYLQPERQPRSGLTMRRVAGEELGAFNTPAFAAVVVGTASPGECRKTAELVYQGLLP